MPSLDWNSVWGMVIPHVIRIAVVVALAYAVWRLLGRWAPNLISLLLRRELRSRDEEDVKQRIDTLQTALRRITSVLLVVAVAVMVLSEVGINVAPVLAGLGVVGIAVGFAAQHLIRDFLNGLILLVEDWYAKGDVVNVAGISGLVEDITLRRTVLRDLDGIVHSVPNGEITIASNLTKEWSRVNLNVTVAYSEDLDRVIAVINQVGRELADDSYFGTLVLEPPQVLRVDNLGNSGVEIKILGNTRPIKQWDVMGELRRRLKLRFDQEGIEIPWPHTKVYFGNPLEQRAARAQRGPHHEAEVALSTMETPHALAERGRLLAILQSRPWGLVTDLDGTISPIAPTPEDAVVPDSVKEILGKLRQQAGLVAVISGRPATQTKLMVGVEGLVYIGNHGLESLENGAVKLVSGAEQYLDTISRALDEVESITKTAGVRIERKGVTASIHYRLANDPDATRAAVLAAVARSPTATGLKITEGKRVVELRPPIPVNKGTAVRSLVASHGLKGLLYLGDDITDLDAFYTLPVLRQEGVQALGIGVVGAENRPDFRAAIDLLVTSVDEVEELLRWLAAPERHG